MDRSEVLVERDDGLRDPRPRANLVGDGSHPPAFPDVVGVVVRACQGDELAGPELDQPVGILGLPDASNEGDLLTQVAADRCVGPLQLGDLYRSLSEEPCR